MRTPKFAFCLLLLAAAPAILQSADGPKRITWGEFSSRVTAKSTIRAALLDGAVVEFRVLRSNPDTLDVRITRTSDPQLHPNGDAGISRNLLSTVEIRRPRATGKLVGALVPLAVGSALAAGGIYGKQGEDSVYGYAVAGGLIAGVGAPVGFWIGRAVDRRFEQFVIVPSVP